ncbi:MAG: hypothetical protein V1646_01875 [bacterium]
MKYKIFIKTILIAGALSNPITLSAMEDWNREAPEAPKKPSSSERTAALEAENKKKQEEAGAADAARKAARTQPDGETQRQRPAPQPPKPTPATETTQKKPVFSFREFFGFRKKEIPQLETPTKPIRPSDSTAQKELERSRQLLSGLDMKSAERLGTVLDVSKLSQKEKVLIIKLGNELLEINPDTYKHLSHEEQQKMYNILKMRTVQIEAAERVVAGIDESRKGMARGIEKLKAELKGKVSEAEIQKRIAAKFGPESESSRKLNQDMESLKERYGVDATKLEILKGKANAILSNLELRESVRKLKNAKKSQLKKEGAYFCETFVSAFKSQDLSQQDEISKISMSTLRQVAPNFLKEQKALIRMLIKQQKSLDPRNVDGHKNLLKRLEAARDAVRIIEKTLNEYNPKKVQAAKRERVKKLQTIKEQELANDKQKYLNLETRELALESNPTPINQRELMNIRIQKKELEDKYGQAPTRFKTLKEAIQANK